VRADGGDWRALGHDEIAPGGGGREHGLVGEVMDSGMRHECRESLDERERVEGHRGRAVPPMSLEAVDDAAVGCGREALSSEPCGAAVRDSRRTELRS
jgi:hypothetical protein